MAEPASSYWLQGQRTEAESLRATLTELTTREYGLGSSTTWNFMLNLAATHSNQGRHAEAEEFSKQVLDKRKGHSRHCASPYLAEACEA
ncbi:hypothetical protein ASPACDRAFT_111327 [Aspergillus aculeatus ATCC 16872]|uniref:MalT-like TPR region domain-containing protein n=1 Tax=Aspergillus aculeatus (strain ATCC 16872 / CBS 172.66 / WB 5094) TaxID=690307 RepID=A0A1L9X500_ASPA1|nr:uncharacterized protein ASPACDRAFT_111327 [Aspergillus aculeatus ATCC 16872]OJK03525.1 hypothetical protein ASPACDRAFT_111327 [Aspergillus aculeatus ATCC 16872]